MSTLLAPALNLAILLGLLFYYLREPLREFIRTRHTRLRDEVQVVRGELESARAKYKDFSSKLSSLESESAALREQARADARDLSLKISAEAKRLSSVVTADAQMAVQSLMSELKGQLYKELGSRVLVRAEELLKEKLTGDERARIRQEFSRQLESAQ